MRDPTDGGLQEKKPVIISKSWSVNWDVALVKIIKKIWKGVLRCQR